MWKRTAAAVIGMAIGGCAPATDTISTVKDETNARVEAFEGRVQMLHPNGEEAGQMTVLTRTRTFPSQNLIIEQTIHVDDASPAKPDEVMVMITVDGEDMKLLELHDKFAGTGRFTSGTRWDWTEWNFAAILEDGLKLDSQMSKTGSTVAIEQQLKTENDSLVFSFTGTMTEISDSAFKRRYKEIYPEDSGDDDDDD